MILIMDFFLKFNYFKNLAMFLVKLRQPIAQILIQKITFSRFKYQNFH